MIFILPVQGRSIDIGLNPRQQFAGAEWLDDLIVRICLKPLDLGIFASTSGKVYHRYVAQIRIRPQGPQQAKPVKSWHHDVGQYQVRR